MSAPRSAIRGSVLLLAVGAVAVLLLLVAAVINWSSAASDAVSNKVAGDQMAACAQAARRYLLSQLSQTGISAAQVTIPANGTTTPVTLADAVNEAERTKVYTGHYTETPGATQVAEATVSFVGGSAMGATRTQVRDLTNSLPSSPVLGGQYFRAVVKCRQSDKREAEYEFVFRYGM